MRHEFSYILINTKRLGIRMREVLFALVLILILTSASISAVSAIPTFYGGGVEKGLWTRVFKSNVRLFEAGTDFDHYPWIAEDIHQLADHGVDIVLRVFWWWGFYNGEIAWNTSVVDMYYNASLIELLEQLIDWQFSHLDMSKIWAVTLSDEEPMYAYQYFWTQASLEKYNDTYHSETGFRLTGRYNLNETEDFVLRYWLAEKFVSVFNRVYDYIKGKWPHLLVIQFIRLWPGALPIWGGWVGDGGIDTGDLKADAYMDDLYFYDVYDNPFWLYEFARHRKSTYPNRDYYLVLWGEEAWPDLAGGFEHIRRNAWVAYLAGVDAIGWFTWHYTYGSLWEREDALGKRLFVYINRLNKELSKLPTFKPRSKVLVIRDQMMSFGVGLCAELGLFNEWDTISQRAFVEEELDLSQYKLIVVNEDRYHNEVVEKLNEYVKSGGNLMMLGGFGWDQTNIYDDEPRTRKFLIEEGVIQEHVWGDIIINVSKPNPLDLTLQYEYVDSSMLAISKNALSENHHSIGESQLIDEQGRPIQMEYCPLVLYHNSSNPEEGSILYWGVVSGPVPPLGIPDAQYEDVVEVSGPDWSYTRFLYRNVTRAFARNYLHLDGTPATRGTENMIITQSEIEEGVILAGISNYYPYTVDINYTLDLDHFDFPGGEYWVHSLDENLTLGWFESQQSLLEVPLDIVPNGTRLLLISQQQLMPSYSVNIFPDIPTLEEVEDLWSEGTPSASFSFSPSEPSPRDTIGFADTSTDSDGTVVSRFWDFGDYSEQWWSMEQHPIHRFVQEGEYTVSLTITDNNGCINTSQQTIIVQNLPPIAEYTFSPSSITAGQEVSFTDTSSHPQGHAIISWSWDFGDGSTSTLQNPAHKYENPGSYTVTLIAIDDEGLERTYSALIDVMPVPDYTIYFVIGGLVIAIVVAVVVIMRRR